MTSFSKRAFTLMEVNLAIFIMAVGVLGMVALYPLGFREGTQSRSDVVEATIADGILNPIVAALSATNMTWASWENLVNRGNNDTGLYPSDGWGAYSDSNFAPRDYSAICGTADSVIGVIDGQCPGGVKPGSLAKKMLSYARSKKMACALVFAAGSLPQLDNNNTSEPYKDKSRIVLALRVSRSAGQLFSAPVFYTEVHFQGQRED